MEFQIPVVPAVILLVLQFISPYLVSLLTSFGWSARTKKIVATLTSFGVSIALLLVSLAVGWLPSDFTPLGIVTLVLLGLGIQQAAYGLLLKDSADELTRTAGVGKHVG